MDKINKLLERKNVKIILLSLLLIVIIITLFSVIPKANKKEIIIEDNGIHAHTEKEIVKEEEYKGIKFTNISMITENRYTTFTADVTNETKQDIENERLHINLKDKEGKSVIKLLAYIPNGLKKGETKTITASAKGEFSEVVSKEIID